MAPSPPARALSSVRRTLVGGAVALLLAGTVVGGGADADTPEASPTGSTSTPSSSASSSASPSESPSKGPSKSPSKSPSKTASTTAPAGRTLEVRVAGDDVTPVAEQVDLAVGEFLTLEVTSDRVGELHIHSDPEHSFDFASGTQTFRLAFDKPGSVDIEEHGAHALVARVLVR